MEIPEASGGAVVSSAGVLLAGVNSDAKRDAFVRVHVQGDHATANSDVLYCLSDAGKLRWKQRLDDRLMFRSGEYGAPWITEDMLVIDPQFFRGLLGELPGISAVEVQLKRGRAENELTRYRYDVVLHVGEEMLDGAELEIGA